MLRSKLNLVDLAGSERVHKTAARGQTLREARYINQSLFYLEMVILALHEKRPHVPVRVCFWFCFWEGHAARRPHLPSHLP